ncbi:hypothetical protein S83_055150, partial [Arachis hypogaea]
IQESDKARKKFSNAKSLSSSQFFGDQNKAADVAAQATLSKFSGSSAISSAVHTLVCVFLLLLIIILYIISGFPESSEAGEAEQQWCCALMQEHGFFFIFPQMEEPSGRTWFKPWCFSLCICGKGSQGLNWASTSLVSKLKGLAERKKLEDLTIGPVLTVKFR